MYDLAGLLARIPDEYKPLAATGLGAFMLVFIVLFHGMGLHTILVGQKRFEMRLRVERPHVAAALLLFGVTVFCMLSLHLVEILIWAFFLTRTGLILHGYDAIYFCANAFTTLGYGNVDIAHGWRNISPVVGISGLFTFAWTTSSLVAVVAVHRELIEQLEVERIEEMHLRFTLRKDEWAALKRARDASRAEMQKNGSQAAGTSLFERVRMWKEEKESDRKYAELAEEEIDELRRKERADEEKVVRDIPPNESADKK